MRGPPASGDLASRLPAASRSFAARRYGPKPFIDDLDNIVYPSPATHTILTQLKAGDTLYQAGELPKTLRVSKIRYELPEIL